MLSTLTEVNGISMVKLYVTSILTWFPGPLQALLKGGQVDPVSGHVVVTVIAVESIPGKPRPRTYV